MDMYEKVLKVVEQSEYGVTVSEVAKKLKVHRNTARFYLQVLEKTGQIVAVEKGRVVLYFPKKGS